MHILVILLNNFIWTKRNGERKLYFIPIGRIKLFIKNTLDENIVSLFYFFFKSAPRFPFKISLAISTKQYN